MRTYTVISNGFVVKVEASSLTEAYSIARSQADDWRVNDK